MQYIVRLFPEITIKSRPVRQRMTGALANNLGRLFAEVDSGINVRRSWDKLDVELPEGLSRENIEDVERVLGSTPGITNFSRVQEYPFVDFDDALGKAVDLWADQMAGKRFVVRVKRAGKHDFTSVDLERYIGGGLLQAEPSASVDLKNPDLTLKLEVRHEQLYLIENTQPGLGGFPLGTQEAVLSLVSGGFDSTVASYLTIRRGLQTHYLFFNLGGRAHEIGVKEVAHYLWDKYHRSHPATFVTVPFEKVVAEILMKIDNAYMGVVLKRMMVRAAQRVASKLGIKALVTGESVAQVSSQTLTNLSVIDAVSETLVMRPLVTMDKPDIIAIAREIGTEEFAANMPEYCGVISVKPTTSARADKVALLESEFPMQVLDQALSEATFQTVSDVLEQMPPAVNVEVFAIPQPGAVLLDIRHPDEAERKPLAVPGASVESLPFYRLQNAFADLPRDRQYLLYCDKGVMSRLHAELLMEEGRANVGVYRPAG